MTIEVSCGGCRQRFAAPDDLAGQQVNCPACSQPIVVPGQVATTQQGVVVACQCGGQFHADASLIGQKLPCPACGRTIVVSKSTQPIQAAPTPPPVSLDDIAASESSWPSSTILSPSPLLSASLQKRAQSNDAAHRRIMVFVSTVGGGLLTLFILGVVIWKIVGSSESNHNSTANADSTASTNSTDDVQSSTDSSKTNFDSQTAEPDSDSTDTTSTDRDDTAAESGEPVDAKMDSRELAWSLHTSKSGRFAVSMPGVVKTSNQSAKTKSVEFSIAHETSTLSDGSVFDVSYVDLPDQETVTREGFTIDDLVKNLVERCRGVLEDEIAIDIGGREGREIRIKGEAKVAPIAIHARLLLVENRAYQVIWAKTGGTAPSGDSETFLQSFRLLDEGDE